MRRGRDLQEPCDRGLLAILLGSLCGPLVHVAVHPPLCGASGTLCLDLLQDAKRHELPGAHVAASSATRSLCSFL